MDVPVGLLLSQYPKHDIYILRHTIPWKEASRISNFTFLIQKIYSIAVQSLLSMCILELTYLLLTELTVTISPEVLIGFWKVKCKSNITKNCKTQIHAQ